MSSPQIQTKWSQFSSLIIVFFFWGFVAASNDILIPVFKKSFSLSQVQSQLVAWAFYVAYFVGSLVFFLLSLKRDILQIFGAKITLAFGLCLSAIGAFGFVPAAAAGSFPLFLTSLFTVGLGFSVQQIVANPLAIKMGSPETGAHRLTLAGAVNSLGTTIGPILLSKAIFGSDAEAVMNLHDVQIPFIVLGLAFIVVVIFLLFSKIENPVPEVDSTRADATTEKFVLTRYPQLILGMVAIFIYVGVEVTIASNLPALLKTTEFGGIDEQHLAPFISLYWGSLMIGRWNGGLNVFNFSKTVGTLLKIIVPLVAFAIIILANNAMGKDMSHFYQYALWIVIFLAISFLAGKAAGRTLMLFGLAGAAMIVLGLFWPDRDIAKYFLISGGLFCSIMWPAIFDLAIAGLGVHTGKASSFLIMMILGGGILPIVQGYICDLPGTPSFFNSSWTHFSYFIPVLCFLYLAFYGYWGSAYLRKRGIQLTGEGGSH